MNKPQRAQEIVASEAAPVLLELRDVRRLYPNGDKVETRRVKIGLSNRQLAEVKVGLKVGERVVVGSAESPAGQKGPNAIRFRGF